MALDRNYFNSIELDPIKNKYYDVTAVDNLLVDIRRQAEAINHKSLDAKTELEAAKAETESYRQKCQELDEEIAALREALSSAEEKANSMEFLLEKKEEKAAQVQSFEVPQVQPQPQPQPQVQPQIKTRIIGKDRMEEMYNAMKNVYTSGLQTLEKQWQNFLDVAEEESIPSDLSSKISQIAIALQEINDELK